ncbi:hypothetical protein HZA73_01965 [candidate division TA06 bacterium]|nr:hypothetical protein [candidate division TA06 bacterium]
MKNRIIDKVYAFIVIALLCVLIIITLLDLTGFINDQSLFSIPKIIFNNISKIQLLLLCLIGISFILERSVYLNKLPAILKNINFNLHEVNKKIDNQIDVMFFPTRRQSYEFLLDEVSQLPSDSNIYITHFEKLKNFGYEDGEEPKEQEFMAEWIRRVQKGNFTIQQIVHISSRADLKELKDRLKRFENQPAYSFSAIWGPPILPFIDLFIVENKWVHISLSNDISSAQTKTFAVAIKDSTVVRNFILCYQAILHNALTIKNRSNIDANNLDVINTIIQTIDTTDIDLKRLFNNQMSPTGKVITDSIENVLSRLDLKNPRLVSLFNDLLYDRFTKALSCYLDIDEYHSYETLKSLLLLAKKRIRAVSISFANEKFWDTGFGTELLDINRKVIKENKVDIERIFIINNKEQNHMHNIIQNQINNGVNAYVIDKNNIADVCDFIIIDDCVVYHLLESTRKMLIGRSKISISPKEVSKYKNIYAKYRTQSVNGQAYLLKRRKVK